MPPKPSIAARSTRRPPHYNAAQDLLERNILAGRGEKIAYIDEAGGYTYCELADRADRSAVTLLTLGIQAEQRIALCLLDTIDFPACFLGAIKAGIVPIPLNTLFQPADYAFIFRDTRAK